MTLKFHPYDQSFVESIRAGRPDAHGQPAERAISGGQGNPCRSCLQDVPKGAGMLILAACPFPDPQPYAEVGPIFFCETACTPWSAEGTPAILTTSPDYLLKGYSRDNRIVYGTGAIVEAEKIAEYATEVLTDARVAYVDVRSARNNCFQTRITQAP